MRWPNLIPVHTPVRASWLNRVEIYFSVLQRKALTPNDFRSLSELEQRLFRIITSKLPNLSVALEPAICAA